MPPEAQDKNKSRHRSDTSPPEDVEPTTDEEIRGFLPDLMRRTLTLGFTGLFLTEEAMRRALGDTVPREWVDFILAQSERTRDELVDRLSQEFGRALSVLDPVELLRRLFEGQTLEVSARIHFASPKESKESGRRSGASVSMRRREDDDQAEDG